MCAVAITWYGHATFGVDVDGTQLVIDPFFKPNSPVASVTQAEVAADVVLITHGHGDHIADAVPLAKRTGAKVISNFEIIGWLGNQGIDNSHAQHLGGGFQHEFGHVKLTPALHGSGLPDGSYGGMPAGLLLTVAGKKIYFAGDTALFSDMALIGAAGLDVAVLPIGDNFTMGPDDSLLALGYLKPKVVIPCHYNTWPVIEVDVHAWAARVAAETSATPVVLEIDGMYIVA